MEFRKSEVQPGCWKEIVGFLVIVSLGLCALGNWLM